MAAKKLTFSKSPPEPLSSQCEDTTNKAAGRKWESAASILPWPRRDREAFFKPIPADIHIGGSMRRSTWLPLLLATAILQGCTNVHEPSVAPTTTRADAVVKAAVHSNRVRIFDRLSVSMPPGCELLQNKDGNDFLTWFILHNKAAVVGIYIGNFPDFPHHHATANEEVTEFKLKDVDVISVWNGPDLSRQEMKIHLPPTMDKRAAFAHIWTTDISPIDRALAAKILSSIQVESE